MNRSSLSVERIGEAFAGQVLYDYFGADIFIGSGIELKLSELASVVYQDVDDADYHGATIVYPSGQTFVALNTNDSLRLRYFTAAHELWHVLDLGNVLDEHVDQEQVADRFAAALMLPEPLMRMLWGRLQKDTDIQKQILLIADLSCMPYQAVAKRLLELKLIRNHEWIDWKEAQWIQLRQHLNYPRSPLDVAQHLSRFHAYEQVMEQRIREHTADYLTAASKLAHTSPDQAAQYQKLASEQLQQFQQDVENDDEA
ncbi:ImmA/IrrE family metallo-endopeptidase [Paenibacillus sp. WLX2291]|uniref:ImmA/IrrE family metallo-endopeptidase n=1 Tax=Paenibacillus sp. WLX2291 TaxID=3296934 RepID=UPI0039841710